MWTGMGRSSRAGFDPAELHLLKLRQNWPLQGFWNSGECRNPVAEREAWVATPGSAGKREFTGDQG